MSMMKIDEIFEKKRIFISKILSESEYVKNNECDKLFCTFQKMNLIKYNLIPCNHNKSNVVAGYKEEESLFGCFKKYTACNKIQ